MFITKRPSNKGKRRFKCTHPGCTTYGYLSVMEASCLDGIPYMCEPHDDQRVIRENGQPHASVQR